MLLAVFVTMSSEHTVCEQVYWPITGIVEPQAGNKIWNIWDEDEIEEHGGAT